MKKNYLWKLRRTKIDKIYQIDEKTGQKHVQFLLTRNFQVIYRNILEKR